MRSTERTIRLDGTEIDIAAFDARLLDISKPIREQQDSYYKGINMLRNFLQYFRKPSDPSLALFHESQPAKIPIEAFIKRGLVPKHGLDRIHLGRDEIWTSFSTKITPSGYFDDITTSYIARYLSYEEMRSDIVKLALPNQDRQIEIALPLIGADPENNHITLEEVYELKGWELTEVKKQVTGFHFHIADSNQRVNFDLQHEQFSPINLSTPVELSPTAYNRVQCAVFLPFLLPSVREQ